MDYNDFFLSDYVYCLACGNTSNEENGACYYCNSHSLVEEGYSEKVFVKDILNEQQTIDYQGRRKLFDAARHRVRFEKFAKDDNVGKAREEYYQMLLLIYSVYHPPDDEKEGIKDDRGTA